MNCPNCKHKNEAQDAFCDHCGHSLRAQRCRHCAAANFKADKYCYSCGRSLSSGRLHGLSHPAVTKKRLVIASAATAVLLFAGSLGAVLSGTASAVVNIYPQVHIGQKTNSLTCKYAGKDLSVTVPLYANINNYYRSNGKKQGLIEQGDFSKYVYHNPSDDTLHKLATDIQSVGAANNLNDDQILELTTCFIQNIPYDDARGTQVLETTGNISSQEQYPYETLYKNSGICTDKTYLGNALLGELGYGSAIFIFPDAEHVALGVSVPSGYTTFGSSYAIMELTTPGFAPGQIPSEVDANDGRPSATINKLSDLSAKDNPAALDFDVTKSINAPTLVIDVHAGKQYSRIVAVKNLENKIKSGVTSLSYKKSILESAYNEAERRDRAQESAYTTYLLTSSTKYDCGYKYDYSYSYNYSFLSSPYSYSSPYKYSCEYVSNPQKDYAYSSYTYALSSYNSQVAYYNTLVNDYNQSLATIKSDINTYQQYQYN
jgi:hypothetical protein